jgi:hypothetical protein
MKNLLHSHAFPAAIRLIVLLAFSSAALAYSPKPDLTVAGAIAMLKTDPNSAPVYAETCDGTTTAPGTPIRTPPPVAGDTATVLSQSFHDHDHGAGTGKVLVPFIAIHGGNNIVTLPIDAPKKFYRLSVRLD